MQDPSQPQAKWNIVHTNLAAFNKFVDSFERRDAEWIRDESVARFQRFRTPFHNTEHYTHLVGDLWELRLRRNPNVLIRIFFLEVGVSLLVITGFYNKKKHPASNYQKEQITIAFDAANKYLER